MGGITRKTYTTDDEIAYINGLKTGRNNHGVEVSRFSKLLNYKRAMRVRENWGDIDVNVIETHINNCIFKMIDDMQNVKPEKKKRKIASKSEAKRINIQTKRKGKKV